jgi:hypothetical protein
MGVDKPVDRLTVSFSELSSWRRCQFQHWLQYRQRWTPKVEKPVFQRGHLWDDVMNTHYQGLRAAQVEGARPADRLEHTAYKMFARKIEALCQDDPDLLTSERELRDLVRWMYSGYIETYGADPKWEILETQYRKEALLTTIDLPDRILSIWLKVYIDLLVRERGRGSRGRIWIVDAKSTSAMGRKDLAFNDQSGLYNWIMALHGLYPEPVFGSIWNYALARKNKTKPQPLPERFKRIPIYQSEVELSEIANDAIATAWQMYAHDIEYQPPRSPNEETCRRFCDYTDACLANRKGHDLAKFLRHTDHEIPEWHKPRLEGLDEFA